MSEIENREYMVNFYVVQKFYASYLQICLKLLVTIHGTKYFFDFIFFCYPVTCLQKCCLERKTTKQASEKLYFWVSKTVALNSASSLFLSFSWCFPPLSSASHAHVSVPVCVSVRRSPYKELLMTKTSCTIERSWSKNCLLLSKETFLSAISLCL